MLMPFAVAAQTPSIGINDHWTVISVSGFAQQLPEPAAREAAQDLAPGDLVAPNRAIATGADGQVTLMRAGAAIIVYPNTVVRLSPPGGGAAATRVFQENGEALYVVVPTPVPSFEVTTPYLSAGVRGTHFVVTNLARRVIVTQGRVSVAAAGSGARVALLPGFQATVTDPDAPRVAVDRAPPAVAATWERRAAALQARLAAASGSGPSEPDRSGSAPASGPAGTDGADTGGTGADTVGGVAGAAGGALGAAGEAVGGALGPVTDGVSGAVGKLETTTDAVGGAVEKTTNGVSGALEGAVGKAKSVGKGGLGGLKGLIHGH
jgi:hypothetical protein